MSARLGDNIEAARRACGLNQAQLGEAIGRSQKTIAHYESGRVEPPLSVLRRIAEATKTSLLELLGEELTHVEILHALAHLNPGSSNPGRALDLAVPIEGIVVGLLIKTGEEEGA